MKDSHINLYPVWNYVYLWIYFDRMYKNDHISIVHPPFVLGNIRTFWLSYAKRIIGEKPHFTLVTAEVIFLKLVGGRIEYIHADLGSGPFFHGFQSSVLNSGSLAYLFNSSTEVLPRLVVFLQYKSAWKIRWGELLGIKEEKYLELREQNTQQIILPYKQKGEKNAWNDL